MPETKDGCAFGKRWVFNFFLKEYREMAEHTLSGKSFQIIGALSEAEMQSRCICHGRQSNLGDLGIALGSEM